MPTNNNLLKKLGLTTSKSQSQYIPKNSKDFIEHDNILKTLSIGIKEDMPVLIIGDSGTGKTSAIRHLAALTKTGLRRVNLNGGTTADEIIGRNMINDKGTYWVDGILVEAMRNGDWILFDEINAALPEVLLVLQSVLDDDGTITLNEKDDKEVIKKHKDFRFFATCNPPEYAGTKEMNQALLSRFPICINADYPSPAFEKEIIKYHLGAEVSESLMTEKLITLAGETRNAKNRGETDYAINTRDIINALKLAEQFTPVEAISLAFANKLEKADTKAVISTAQLHLPKNEKKMQKRKKVKKLEEIEIGKTYIIETDVHNAYYMPTSDLNTLRNTKFSTIVMTEEKEAANREEEFKVVGLIYDNKETMSEQKETDKGSVIALVVETGETTKKYSTMIISPTIPESMEIIKNLSLIE